jgi:hypothetical protein
MVPANKETKILTEIGKDFIERATGFGYHTSMVPANR